MILLTQWESLEGIIDQPHLNNRLHGDYVDNEQVNITPDFDPILNKLVAESSSEVAPIQQVRQMLEQPSPFLALPEPTPPARPKSPVPPAVESRDFIVYKVYLET